MFEMRLVLCVFVLFLVGPSLCAGPAFDGQGDFQRDDLGYYYAITGGKFPTGNTPNGDNASGGTFRFIFDDPDWQTYYPTLAIDVWHKDDWFQQNAGIALTIKNGSSILYDNNGIEDGTCGNYYDATAQGLPSASTPGLYRGYSMSNNYDWIYAGYFKIEQAITFDTLIGYFDENSGFDRNNPNIAYRMNIWSNVPGDLLPVNTGSFAGDVFSSDSVPGVFSTSYTGVDRVFGVDYGSARDPIFRLTYRLDSPFTLGPGIYWFSHDAVIRPIPEPAFVQMAMLIGLGGLSVLRVRRSR
ncbi:MAG: hypothetical protein ACUVS8_13275 [Armatimonadota bacterium]